VIIDIGLSGSSKPIKHIGHSYTSASFAISGDISSTLSKLAGGSILNAQTPSNRSSTYVIN